MTISDRRPWIAVNKSLPPAQAGDALITELLAGSYQPQPVRGVEIPKPRGGKRQLGIPTVVDRLVQQAIRGLRRVRLCKSWIRCSIRASRRRASACAGTGAHDALHQARKCTARTPQGDPLSPLLANLLLDDLDKNSNAAATASAVAPVPGSHKRGWTRIALHWRRAWFETRSGFYRSAPHHEVSL